MLRDLGAERAVLAGIFKYGQDAFIDICDKVDVNCFTDTKNGMIFRSFEQCFENGVKNIDLASLAAAAQQLGYYDLVCKKPEDVEYIQSLGDFPILLENVRQHGKKLAILYVANRGKSELQSALKSISEVNGTENFSQILSILESPSINIIEQLSNEETDGPKAIGEGIEEYINEAIENPVDQIGIPTPWPIFNKVIGGGLRTGVSLVVARKKTGKSICGKEAAVHIAGKLRIPVLYIDTEMDETEQRARTLASLANVSINQVETGKYGKNKRELEAIRKAAGYLKGMPFYHQNVSGKQFEEIRAIIKRWIHKNVGLGPDGKANPHVVIYDYFKLMDEKAITDNIAEYQALGFQISKMSDFCKAYNTPILAFTQANREGDVSQSDRLTWLAIVVAFLRTKTPDEIANDGPTNGNRKLEITDCRFGKPLDSGDYIHFHLDGEFSSLKELGTKQASVRPNNTGFQTQQPQDTVDDETD